MNYAFIITILLFISSCLGFKFECSYHILTDSCPKCLELIVGAAYEDPFFKDVKITRPLGYGSFGAVFQATIGQGKSSKQVAIKFSEVTSLYHMDRPDNKFDMPNIAVDDIIVNPQVLTYLKAKGVPFAQTYYIHRYITGSVGQISYMNTLYSKPKTVAIIVMDLGELDDYFGFIKSKANHSPTSLLKILIELAYQLSLSIQKANSLGIIHGDLKLENIFAKKCNSSRSGICPMIGDWDMAVKFDDNTQPDRKMRYTPIFRTPEQHFFMAKEDEILTGPGGYNISGKEDVFALGITFVQFILVTNLDKRDISPEEADKFNAIINLIEGMIYPVRFSDALGFFKDDIKYDKTMENVYAEYYKPEIPPMFIQNHENISIADVDRKIGSIMADVIKKQIILVSEECRNRFDRTTFMINRYSFDKDRLLSKFFVDFEKACLNTKLISESLELEELYFFYSYLDHIHKVDPFQEMVKARLSMTQVFSSAYKLYYNTLQEPDEKKVKDDIKKALMWANSYHDKTLVKVKDDGKVSVMGSFYKLSLEQQLKICKLMIAKNGKNIKPVKLAMDDVKVYNISAFCESIRQYSDIKII